MTHISENGQKVGPLQGSVALLKFEKSFSIFFFLLIFAFIEVLNLSTKLYRGMSSKSLEFKKKKVARAKG